MTRKKVQLAFITNESARKASYKKRKSGLINKVNEISTLCGVDACCIIYGPYDAQPVLWPPSDIEVQRVLGEFRRMPEMDQSKKMVNQETFLRERIIKLKDQLKKLIKDNREKEMVEIMFQCLLGKDMSNMTMMEFNDLAWLIDVFIRDITIVSEKLRRVGPNVVVVQGNVAGPDLVVDTKPPIHGVNPSMINPAISTGNPLAFEAMQQNIAANWFPGGNYGASSSNNQPYRLPVVGDNMRMPPLQFSMGGGFVFNPSSNNQPLGLPGVSNDMVMPPPPQFGIGAFVFNRGASSSSNQPLELPAVNNDIMMPAPPPQFNMGGFVFSSGASSSNNQLLGLPVVSNNDMMLPPPQFNMGVFGDNSGASSSNNQPSSLLGVSSDMMPPPPPPPQVNMGGM